MGDIEIKLGELLKLERERQGKKLSVISENLRISEANLQAVEAGDMAAVPSEVYFKLFAKSYAEAIGIDYAATIEAIKEDAAQSAEDPKKAKRPKQAQAEELGEDVAADEETSEPVKPGTHWKVVGIAGALIVVLLGAYAVFNIFPAKTGQENSEVALAPSNPAFARYNWNTPSYQPPDSLRLVLTPRGESWGTVLADGDTAVFRNMVPGRVYYAAAKYRLQMYVALPKVVDIKLNNQTISPVDPETGRNSRIEITQANVDSILTASQAPTEPTVSPKTSEAPATTAPRTAADTAGNRNDEF